MNSEKKSGDPALPAESPAKPPRRNCRVEPARKQLRPRSPRRVSHGDTCPSCGRRGPCVYWWSGNTSSVLGEFECLNWPRKTSAERRELVALLAGMANTPITRFVGTLRRVGGCAQ